MISAATGSVALVSAPLVRSHGLDHLVLAVLLAGALQVLLGVLHVDRLMRFVPRSVMVGFVNALGILLFTAQLPHLTGVPVAVYVLVVAGLAIMALLPRLTRAVPAPLVAIVALTAVTVAAGIDVPTVGDAGELPTALPLPGLPDVPFTWGTLQVVAPYAVTIALVGLLESLLTARLVDDVTETTSDGARESRGQGIANVLTAVFGGMGGCAMIGQTMINVKVGGARTRLSTFLAGAFLLVLVMVLAPLVAVVPMAALVAVMVLVSFSTIDWHSVRPATLRRMPRGETAVMVVTVGVVLATDNLAIGVIAGVVAASVLFAHRVARMVEVTGVLDPEGGTRVYSVHGEVFFASGDDLVRQFDYAGDPGHVVIDLSDARIWDASSVAALDAVTTRYAAHGTTVEITGLSGVGGRMHARLTGTLG